MDDLISRQSAIDVIEKIFPADPMRDDYTQGITCGAALANIYVGQLPSAQPETHEERTETHACDCISRQDAIRIVDGIDTWQAGWRGDAIESMKALPSAQPDLVRCKDCEYGEQDEVGRWFCRGLGCQIGNEDGSGYCADAERRTDE